MIKQKLEINDLRVASPCSIGWENMSGDEKTRFCQLCSLNVYNISEMTAGEVRALFVKTEGKFCGRIYKRADGTVLTKDCPVGLRAYYRRTARFAGAAFTAIISLFSFGFGQNSSKKEKVCKVTSQVKILRAETKTGENVIEGTVTDSNGAVIPGATVTLKNEDTDTGMTTTTNDEGYYKFSAIASGNYTLSFNAINFKSSIVSLEVKEKEELNVSTKLEPGDKTVVLVGVVSYDNWIDMSSTSITHTINRGRFPY